MSQKTLHSISIISIENEVVKGLDLSNLITALAAANARKVV